jgi:hypothetical protein
LQHCKVQIVRNWRKSEKLLMDGLQQKTRKVTSKVWIKTGQA